MINVTDISKSYGSLSAVCHATFQINKGEITGFLGPNGAGKSTTLKMLAGVLAPDSGKVEIKGKDINTAPIECKRHIGFLAEDNPLYGNMYVREYLEYAARFYLPQKGIKEATDKAIESCGLASEYKKKIDNLSKGNRQRVGLAQAIIHHPEFLILDEPTTGLDPAQQEEMLRFISAYAPDTHILFSTHTLQEVKSICSRVIIIHKGIIRINETIDKNSDIEDLFFEHTR